MSKITLTKRQRAIWRDGRDKHGKRIKNVRIAGYEPPERRKMKTVEYRGVKMMVMVAPGQIINPGKEYKRRAKKDVWQKR